MVIVGGSWLSNIVERQNTTQLRFIKKYTDDRGDVYQLIFQLLVSYIIGYKQYKNKLIDRDQWDDLSYTIRKQFDTLPKNGRGLDTFNLRQQFEMMIFKNIKNIL